jgi:sigma-B regulation protein RsbU (phosphoserine phosphatase)
MVTVSVAQTLSPQGGQLLKMKTPEAPFYRIPPPAEVLHRLDEEFPMERFGKFFTIAYLLLNMKTGVVRHCRAAHPSPIVLSASGEIVELAEGGTIVGFDGNVVRREGETQLEPGDRVILTTDGIAEAPNVAGERFGDARVHDALRSTRGEALQAACDAVVSRVTAHASGLPFPDDMTVFALEWKGAA